MDTPVSPNTPPEKDVNSIIERIYAELLKAGIERGDVEIEPTKADSPTLFILLFPGEIDYSVQLREAIQFHTCLRLPDMNSSLHTLVYVPDSWLPSTEIPENPVNSEDAPSDRLQRLTDLLPTFTSEEELLAFAASLVTEHEAAILERYFDFKQWLGKDAESAPPGELTTREKMLIAWYRAQPDGDGSSLLDTLKFIHAAEALWKSKGGAK